jgi:hypothetical protein
VRFLCDGEVALENDPHAERSPDDDVWLGLWHRFVCDLGEHLDPSIEVH